MQKKVVPSPTDRSETLPVRRRFLQQALNMLHLVLLNQLLRVLAEDPVYY